MPHILRRVNTYLRINAEINAAILRKVSWLTSIVADLKIGSVFALRTVIAAELKFGSAQCQAAAVAAGTFLEPKRDLPRPSLRLSRHRHPISLFIENVIFKRWSA